MLSRSLSFVGCERWFMLMAAYKIKWVAGYLVSSTLEFFLYKAVIHRVYSVICFLLNPRGGGMLTRLTPSYSGCLVCLPVAEWGLGYSLWKQADAGVLLQGEGSSGFRSLERKGKDERSRDRVPGLGYQSKILGTRAGWQIWYGATEQNIKNNCRIAKSRVVVVQSLCRVSLCDPKDCNTIAPGVCSNSCPVSRWCNLTISSSVAPFSSCPQSSPASGSLPMSGLFASGGQTIGASASATILPVNTQGWFPLGLTGLISVQPKGLAGVLSSIITGKKSLEYFHTIKM